MEKSDYFHKYITSVFENNPQLYVEDRLNDFDEDSSHFYIAERPKVYKRSGDSKIYDENLMDLRSGGIYRSLHYIIKYKGYYVEIREELFLKKDGVKSITILSIHIFKMMLI